MSTFAGLHTRSWKSGLYVIPHTHTHTASSGRFHRFWCTGPCIHHIASEYTHLIRSAKSFLIDNFRLPQTTTHKKYLNRTEMIGRFLTEHWPEVKCLESAAVIRDVGGPSIHRNVHLQSGIVTIYIRENRKCIGRKYSCCCCCCCLPYRLGTLVCGRILS